MSKNNELSYLCAAKYLWQIIRPHKRYYFAASIIALILMIIEIMKVKFTEIMINSVTEGTLIKVIYSLMMFLLLAMVAISLEYFSGIFVSKLSSKTLKDLKSHLSKKLAYGKYDEIMKLKSGDTMATVNMDTKVVCDFIGGDLTGLFSQFVMLIGALGYLFFTNPMLALITFAYTPVGMFFTLTLNKKMKGLYKTRGHNMGETLSLVEQALSQIPVIKSFLMEKSMKRKIYEGYNNVYNTEMKISIWNALLQTACSSTSAMPKILYLIFGARMIMKGQLTLGTFIGVFDMLNYIIGPSVYFPFLLNGLNRSVASINRIETLEKISMEQGIKAFEKPEIPSIEIDRIYFGYGEGSKVIKNLSFNHKGPGIIALKGKSGSGKTTLIDLISGLYKPCSGAIKVNGDISVVTQEPYVFQKNLIENIRIARENATDEEVKKALDMAGAEKLKDKLPEGYDTILGDGNVDLSGGEKQRISLARTILSQKSIWILDEPTSALDSDTEKVVLGMIRKMSKEKLILISAHKQWLHQIASKSIDMEAMKGDEIYDSI